MDYNGVTDDLEVRLSTTNVRPVAPLLTRNVNLVAELGQTNAYVGFTSGTGGGSNNHDIRQWKGDTVPPTVISTNPQGGDADVPIEIAFSVQFSEPMNQPSVLGWELQLENTTRSVQQSLFEEAKLSEIIDVGLANAQFNPTGDTITVSSSWGLAYSQSYRIAFTEPPPTDVAGNPLQIDSLTFDFTTVGEPAIQSVAPSSDQAGGQFTVDIKMQNVTDLFDVSFVLNYTTDQFH